MEGRPVRFGAISLLLLAVAICLAVLGVLSYSTAHASSALAQRAASHASAAAETEVAGQEWLSEVDEACQGAVASSDPQAYLSAHLPSGTELSGNVVSAEIAGGAGQTLQAALTLDGSYRYTITSWSVMTSWTEDTSLGGSLWSGQ